MIQVTKIFHFEMAHAIYGYPGACKNIHGHSYKLYVTIGDTSNSDEYIAAPGFVYDFKLLKKSVNESIIQTLDHSLVLSREFLSKNYSGHKVENLKEWEMEPSVENILLYIKSNLKIVLPPKIKLLKLKLYETADSYAEWFL